MSIDYEAEYNNRARVPDHPQIFARWEREAAAYRGEAEQAGHAELGLAYGPTPRQSIDLFYPAATKTGPLSLFIHGGYWRSLAPSQFSHVARGLNGHGITVAVAGYDLCPDVTIADIIAETRAACLFLWRRFGRKIMTYGHSAGGHLAACLLATDWRALAADAPRDLVPAAAAISGLFDLVPLVGVSMNADLRLTAAEARAASPLFWPAPSGLALETWCGALESGEFRRQNRIIAETWGKAGVDTVCLEVPDLNHFTVLDPLGQPESELTRRLAALARRTGSNEARASAWRVQLFELIRRRSFGRGRIKLASGRESDFYFDLRPTALHPAGATCIGEMIVDALDGLAVDYVGGLEMGAVPIATAAAIAAHRRGRDISAFFVRKQPKEHGERKRIEGLPKGESLRGKNVVVVEDVTTTGGSAVKAAEAVEAEGGTVALVLTIVDRLEGAGETFAAARLPFRSLFTADEFLNA